MRHKGWALAAGIAASTVITPLHAEVKEVVLGAQYGAVYLPAMAMESHALIERHLATGGLNNVKVTWVKLGGPAAINDAMIAGSLHFACQGVPSLAVIWDRTRGGIGVKAVGAVASNNNWLNTRSPHIRSLNDFTEKDRIAVPSVKVAAQTILMHIAAEKLWGAGNHTKLDHLFVALPNPEGMAAVMSQGHEVNANFTTSPFHEIQMKAGLTTVTSAFEIMGGSTTGLTFTSSETFHVQNPKVFAAVNGAFDEALEWVNADKRRAARLYMEMAHEKKLREDEVTAIISSKDMEYTKVPRRFGALIEFMYRTGYVKNKPASWKDLFFEEAHGLPGS
jgi:NitT/TauT family transport system substrate-binding protein